MKNPYLHFCPMLRHATALVVIFFLTACNAPTESADIAIAPEVGDNRAIGVNKISLDKATYDDIANHVYECQGHKLCVLVCHRPPGNPDNSITKELPLQAIAAHLSHGGNHEDKDYLGECVSGEEPPVEDPPAEDPPAQDPPAEEIPTPDDDPIVSYPEVPSDIEVPLWCQPYAAIDTDCDGYEDDSGQPLF